jgi:CRISP-associated protein Cas1
MKRTHLNTLFVSTEGSYLGKEGEAVVVKQGDEKPLRVPIHMLHSIVCLGPVKVSPHLMGLCAERDVSISFHKPSGKLLARVVGFTPGNVLLRREQFRAAEARERSLELARPFVIGKILNQRVLLLRAARDHGDQHGVLGNCAATLHGAIRRAQAAGNHDALRGIEGEAATIYFRAFPHFLRSRGVRFTGRSRRPPRDPVNALLSFAYAMLASDVRSACESVGLDSQVGFLHSARSGRPALALDLMEELRPIVADRVTLTLLNRQQVTPGDFTVEINGATRMTDAARKTFLVEFQRRKQEVIEHPFLGERVTLGQVPFLQARLLAKAIRGELDAYPPFLWR